MQRLNRLRSVLAMIALCIAGAGAVSAGQQTNNYELRAVPAPAAVRVDGTLAEWDRSGEILACYDIADLIDRNSVRVSAMYDREYLYLAFRFRDHTPLINHIDPVNDVGGGWKSDSVELRLQTDQIVNIEAWYYTDAKKPTVFIGYGLAGKSWQTEITEALKESAKQAFQIDADGKGYVQELALPWKLLYKSGAAPAAGGSFKMGIQLNWGDASGSRWPSHRYADLINPANPQREFFWNATTAWGTVTLTPAGNLPPSPSVAQLSKLEEWQKMQYTTGGVVPIRYHLEKSGFVTLAIDNAQGARVRNLIGSFPRSAGENTDYWDGADDDGKPVPAGEYQVRGLFREAFDLTYEFTYGNPGNPAWGTPDTKGGWLSNHTDPMSVAADKERVYFSSPFAEGATSIMAADRSGRRLWGISNINGGMLASDGKYLYALVGGPTIAWGGAPENEVTILRIDAATGKYAPFADGKQMHTIAKIPPAGAWLRQNRPEGELYAEQAYNATYCQRQSMGLAFSDGKLFASLYYQNEIVVIDAAKGEATGKIAVPSPAGLAASPDGTIYAISGKQIVRIASDATVTPAITENLSAPVGLAVSASGELYVSDWGTNMGVRVFSPSGKFLRQIGQPNGRPLAGAYQTGGMYLPWGLALDTEGSLWVAEYDSSPKRISVWNPQTGALQREFCGTTPYSAGITRANQFNPKQAFMLNNTCELDWKKGQWRITGSFSRPDRPGAWFGITGDCWGGVLETVRCKGKDYLLTSTHGVLCVLALAPDHARPLAAVGSILGLLRDGCLLPELVVRNLAAPEQLARLQQKYPRLLRGERLENKKVSDAEAVRKEIHSLRQEPGLRQYFQWADANGDAAVQENEIRFLTMEEAGGQMLPERWKPAVDSNLTLYLSARGQKGNTNVWRLPVREWNAQGAPVYDYKDVKQVISAPERKGIGDCGITWATPEGDLLLLNKPLQMYSPQGALRWQYPNDWPGVHGSHTAPQSKEGRVIGPLYVLGAAELPAKQGSVFCLNGNLGERYLLTTDGLFVANLLRDCRSAPDSLPDVLRRGESVNRMSAGGEPFGGEFFRNPLDGNYYLGGSLDTCREASMLLRLHGLQSVRRLPLQRITLNAQQLAQAQEQRMAKDAAADTGARTLRVKRLDNLTGVPAQTAFDWQQAAQFRFDAAHAAQATWGYDDKNLYLAFRDVSDDTPLVNGGDDFRLLFKTGDALVFELRKNPDLKTPEVSPGDIRLLVSVLNGKPVAVLYDYRVPGTQTPVPFASPVGTTNIDVVRILEHAQIEIDRAQGAYSVRVAVPLTDLSFRPAAGKKYRGDFGVVYSDKSGKLNELRMYWANPVSGMVKDIFSESQIIPGNWGSFEISK